MHNKFTVSLILFSILFTTAVMLSIASQAFWKIPFVVVDESFEAKYLEEGAIAWLVGIWFGIGAMYGASWELLQRKFNLARALKVVVLTPIIPVIAVYASKKRIEKLKRSQSNKNK